MASKITLKNNLGYKKIKEEFIKFNLNGFKFRNKVAAFDYDHTLVKPIKTTFSLNIDDWTWLRKDVPNKLKELYNEGFSIVIFTNQTKTFKIEQIKISLESLHIPLSVYVGTTDNSKKPNTFLWNLFIEDSNVDIITGESFYVGDALGRDGDWSDTDGIFAKNIGICVKTPEEMFPYEIKVETDFTDKTYQELVLMMGYPGSGKSSYINNKISDNYKIITCDDVDLKTESKRKKRTRDILKMGFSAVLDATHASRKKRKIFIDIAKEYNIPVRLIHLNTSFEESKERNINRINKVPLIALYMYRKNYEEPLLEEGYDEILLI